MTSPRVDVLRGLQMLRLGAIAFPVAAALVWGFFLYQSAYRATTRHVLVQSHLIAQHLESLIETQRVMHRGVAARLAGEAADFAARPEFQHVLAEVVAAQPSLLRMQVLSGAGQVLSDSAAAQPGPNLLPQDHRDALAAGEPLWIGRQLDAQGDVLMISSAVAMPEGPG